MIVFPFDGFVGGIRCFSLINFCLLLFVGVSGLPGVTFSLTTFPFWLAILSIGFLNILHESGITKDFSIF